MNLPIGKKFTVRAQANSAASKAKNRYFTLFVCAKSRGKVFIAHRKKKHFPAVYLKFIQRIGRHPQLDASQFV